MATLKEVQSKIVSVKKTKQITSAMKMVATSRLRGAQNSMEAFAPYASKFAEVLGSIAGKSGEDASPTAAEVMTVSDVASATMSKRARLPRNAFLMSCSFPVRSACHGA
jgi:F-type H+-transporting ATPase subunit gamma